MGWFSRRQHESATPQPVVEQLASVAIGAGGYAVIDVETTGLIPGADRVLELAIVHLDERLNYTGEWTGRFNPQRPVGATHIHGITQADVAHQPVFAEQARTVASYLAGRTLVGHNLPFDMSFLAAEFATLGWRAPAWDGLDTLQAAYSVMPGLSRYRLVDCCEAAKIPQSRAHCALFDARATAMLFQQIRWAQSTGVALGPPAPAPRQRMAATHPRLDLLDRLDLGTVLDEGAPESSLAYVELLAQALEDGVLTDQERIALSDHATTYGLDSVALVTVHEALLTGLARLAVEDGRVNNDEKAEIRFLAELLGVDAKKAKTLLDRAGDERLAAMGEDLAPLPADWGLGEPLRVGDRVVCTGPWDGRDQLEAKAESVGVCVVSSVTKRTAMLVTDGSFYGTKAEQADELGTRRVTPGDFSVYLAHLQPAEVKAQAASARTAEVPPQRVAPPCDSSPQVDAAAVRAWARSRGQAVGERGRLPAPLVEQYVAQHPNQSLPA